MTPPWLTPQETEALRFIKAHQREWGVIPSYRAINAACGINGFGKATQNIIIGLEAKGCVERHGKARKLTLTERAFRNPCLVEFQDDVWQSLVGYARAEKIAPETFVAEAVRSALGVAA